MFPGVDYVPVDLDALREQISNVCAERRLVQGERWINKILQLYQIQKIQHGLMMVGPSGSGKTNAWQVLLAALERLDGIEGVSYVIDPKAMHKDALYGTLDPTTREWNDGLFTHTLRKIVDDVRGESSKRHWIIFDGDVDPEWVENLNRYMTLYFPECLLIICLQCPRRQQVVDSAQRRTSQPSLQCPYHVRGRASEVRDPRHCQSLWYDLVQR